MNSPVDQVSCFDIKFLIFVLNIHHVSATRATNKQYARNSSPASEKNPLKIKLSITLL